MHSSRADIAMSSFARLSLCEVQLCHAVTSVTLYLVSSLVLSTSDKIMRDTLKKVETVHNFRMQEEIILPQTIIQQSKFKAKLCPTRRMLRHIVTSVT